MTERGGESEFQAARALLDSLGVLACALDPSGLIVVVNQQWEENGARVGVDANTWLGLDYLKTCRGAEGPDAQSAAEVLSSLEHALTIGDGERTVVYPCRVEGELRWFEMRVAPVDLSGIRALVTHRDVTDREIQRLDACQQLSVLTARELEVAHWVARGLSSESIARHLSLSVNTINNHRRAISRKIASSNAAVITRLIFESKISLNQ